MKIKRLNRVILAIGVGALLSLSSALMAESYKCEKEGVVVYSDTRCGPVIEKSREVQNSYSGAIRPGEQQMLNDALRQSPAAGPAGSSGSNSYGERTRQLNEQRKASGNERRIERDATSPWR
ncbi:MAG: DUF4124 domain-containing protein [Sedimenticola sp.]|nr:DUF4124 domain-containing protein [Sedimenticola sp.]